MRSWPAGAGPRPPARRRGVTYLPGLRVRECGAPSRRSASCLLPPPRAPAPRRDTQYSPEAEAAARRDASQRRCPGVGGRLREGLAGPARSTGGRSPRRGGPRGGGRWRRRRRPGDPGSPSRDEGCACARCGPASPWPAGRPARRCGRGLRARAGLGPCGGCAGLGVAEAGRRLSATLFPLFGRSRGDGGSRRLRPVTWRPRRSPPHVTSDRPRCSL